MAKIARGQRQRIPPQPRTEHRVSTMLVRSKQNQVVSVRSTGWKRDEKDSNLEQCRMMVTLADGKSDIYLCEVRYADGEREEILQAVMDASPTRQVRSIASAALKHRSSVVQEAYRKMQADYGPLPATEYVSSDEMPMTIEVMA